MISFSFPDCGTIPPPVIMVQSVSFRYSPDRPYVYKDIDFGVDLETRVALVGPNGAGKSTLLKLIDGEVSLHSTFPKSSRKGFVILVICSVIVLLCLAL